MPADPEPPETLSTLPTCTSSYPRRAFAAEESWPWPRHRIEPVPAANRLQHSEHPLLPGLMPSVATVHFAEVPVPLSCSPTVLLGCEAARSVRTRQSSSDSSFGQPG